MVLWQHLSKSQSVLWVLLDILTSCYKIPFWFCPRVEEVHGARRMSAFLLTKEGLKQESEEFISIWDSLGTTGALNIMSCFLKTWKITMVMFRRAQNWNLSQMYFGMCKVTVLVSCRSSNLRPGLGGESLKHTVSSFSFDFYFVSPFSSSIMPTPQKTHWTFMCWHPTQTILLSSKIWPGTSSSIGKLIYYTLNFLMGEREAEYWGGLETGAFLCEARYAEAGNVL